MEFYLPELPNTKELVPYFDTMNVAKVFSNFGPFHETLLSEIAEYFNVQVANVALFCNATVAMQSVINNYLQLNNKITKIFIPSYSFTATAAAAVQYTKICEFVPFDEKWNPIFPESRAQSILIDVLPYGLSNRENYEKYSSDYILVDAAASLGNVENILNFNSRKSISYVFSLHPTKMIPGVEGGIVISNNVELIDKVKQWTNFGIGNNRISEFVGTNAKMSEVQAIYGLISLRNIKQIREKWKNLNSWARKTSENLSIKVNSSLLDPNQFTNYWVIETESIKQLSTLKELLREYNIPNRNWWPMMLNEMPAYRNISSNLESNLCSRTTALPMHLHLTTKDQSKIEIALEEFLARMN